MNSIGTTSIDALPISPQTPDNIRLDINNPTVNMPIDNQVARLQQSREADLQQAQGQQGQQGQGQAHQMSQQNISQLVNGLQQASASGLTSLPSRDIPQTQGHLTQDQYMKPNYVPEEQHNTDYITEHQTNEEILRKNYQKEHQMNSLDNFYNNLQTPLLIAILYFIFQLPVVRKNLFKFVPMLFSKDGNPNLIGYLVNSCIFAGLYFSMTKGIHYFSL